MSTPSIQLAFQGGGARLIDMLPVAAAFKHCHAYRQIRITAISGTSAGAICAALIATNCDFEKLCAYLAKNGQKFIGDIVPPQIAALRQMNTAGWLGKAKIIWDNRNYLSDLLFEGKPAFDDANYAKFINEILSFGDKQIETFEEAEARGIKLYISASNIADSSAYLHRKGSIAKAVIDSSSIPFAFRSFARLSANHLVDGGLCDNLPVDCLVQNTAEPIFAVFPEDKEDEVEIHDILTYSLRLFSASINHSVKRSKDKVSKAFSISVKTDLSTFDFSGAVKKLENIDWFRRERDDHILDIRDFANSYGAYRADHEFRFVDVTEVGDYIESLEMLTGNYCDLFDYELGRFEIRINSDETIPNGEEPERRVADTVTKIAHLKALSVNSRYFKSAMTIDTTTREPLPTLWSAYNLTKGQAIPIKVLTLNKHAGSMKAGLACLVVFLNHLQHISVDDIIELRDTVYMKDGMSNLNRGKQDFFGFENPHGKPVSSAELVLIHPERLGTMKLINDPHRSTISNTDVTEIIFSREERLAYGDRVNVGGLRCGKLDTNAKFYCLAIPQ